MDNELTFEQHIRHAIEVELRHARTKHPERWHSAHEGYAIILEELDEAWDEIKHNNLIAARSEMLQVAAMALRFLEEVTPRPEGIDSTEIPSETGAVICSDD